MHFLPLQIPPWIHNICTHTMDSHTHTPLHTLPLLLEPSTPNLLPLPEKFLWPREEETRLPGQPDPPLNEPLLDLRGFFDGDAESTRRITELVRSACLSHGLFQVINHGVDPELIDSVHGHVRRFFSLPIGDKIRVRRQPGSFWGYSVAHADRFSRKLPWKETVSCCFREGGPDSETAGFFRSAFGGESEEIGWDFQRYCEAMKRLSLAVMEILGMSLGVEASYFRDFFRDGNSIMRCNFYPPCQEPGLTLGTGPHCDPTALTILYQDQVGGLQVFEEDKWKSVRPRHDALVVSLGDTFSALSNGVYKSCPHRAVVNKSKERVSMVHFLCPNEDKVIVPPQHLVTSERVRVYPDFKWSDFLRFTHQHYRVDFDTLQNFTKWLQSYPTNPT